MKQRLIFLLALSSLLALTACNKSTPPAAQPEVVTPEPTAQVAVAPDLAAILDAQPEEVKARYGARHPKETLEFFGIAPGMTVVEALPGEGWYSKILLPYLGAEGHLIGADYAADMYPKFGFFDDTFLEAAKTWVTTWPVKAEDWRAENSATVSAFALGSLPEEKYGTADAVLFVRALHNLARFESDGGYLTAALQDTMNVLKPGGIVGVVQHMAAEDADDAWANGSRGYLKKSWLIARMQAAGFELVASSDINVNPADQPSAEEVVWRLPPSLATSKDNPELTAKYEAIGESTRMTLTFRKPLAAAQ